jgi:vancomycin permeability regulator SanA
LSRWIAIIALTLLTLALPKWILGWQFGRRITSPAGAPAATVAIVFGAGLRRDGSPTTVLADRVATAADLFHSGKVERLLMSGSVRPGYNEPEAMATRAEELGVPREAILVDPGGVRTFESCLRARHLLGVRSALLVSQRFHLPRALALGAAQGIEASGVAADRSNYSGRAQRIWELREYPASLVAFFEALLARSTPSRPT